MRRRGACPGGDTEEAVALRGPSCTYRSLGVRLLYVVRPGRLSCLALGPAPEGGSLVLIPGPEQTMERAAIFHALDPAHLPILSKF